MITLIRRTIEYYFKSSKEYIFLFIFPIVIMTSQYMMMEKIFGGEVKSPFEDTVIYYEIKEAGVINESSIETILNPLGAELVKGTSNLEEDIQIEVDNKNIKITANNNLKANSITNIINSYNRKINVIALSSGVLSKEIKVSENIIKGEDKISSKDYYGVTMISMFFITVGLVSSGMISKERRNGIKERLKILGVSNKKYYCSSLIGFLIIAIIGLLPGYLYSYYVLETNWGGNPIIPYLVIIPFSTLFISIVMFFTSILKSGEKVVGIVGGIAFPILGMLGGAFFPIDSYMPQWFNSLSYVSPLKWFNNGMMQMIYKGNNIHLIIGSIVALLIGIALLIVTIKNSDRVEAKS